MRATSATRTTAPRKYAHASTSAFHRFQSVKAPSNQHHQRLSAPNASDGKDASPSSSDQKSGKASSEGYIDLIVCSLLWGTYNPSLRFVYQSEYLHLDPQSLTAIRTIGAAVALGIALALSRGSQKSQDTSVSAFNETEEAVAELLTPFVAPLSDSASSASQSVASASANAATTATATATAIATAQTATSTTAAAIATAEATAAATLDPEPQDSGASTSAASSNILTWTSSSVVLSGIELGLYNFMGTSSQAMGLQLSTATRAGFLIQLTSVFVPILGYLAGERISPQVGAAVVLGIMGSLLVTYDGVMANAADATGSASAGGGEVFLLTACLFYSLSVVRLGVHAPRFNSVDLAAVKKFTLCTTSIIWWLSTRPAEFFTGVSDSAADFFSGASNSATAVTEVVPVDLPPIIFLWGIVAYSSLGPGALATFLQTKGQTLVPATQAQIIFSLTPLWGAGIAFLTIGSDGSEAMGPLSWGGGLVMVLASLLASQGSKKEETGSKTA